MYQWREGEERLRQADPADQGQLDGAMFAVLEELRRRLGSSFAGRRARGALQRGHRVGRGDRRAAMGGMDAVVVVDAAFARYAREAADFAGGRRHIRLVTLPVVVRAAGALDDDPVGLDGDRDRPVAAPVLGVQRVVLDGGVEPQAVALLAVVEGALQRLALAAAPAASAAPAPAAALAGTAVLAVGVAGVAIASRRDRPRPVVVLLLGSRPARPPARRPRRPRPRPAGRARPRRCGDRTDRSPQPRPPRRAPGRVRA